MDQRPQHHLLLLTRGRARAQGRAHVPLHHAVGRLALGPLGVLLPVRPAFEALCHQSPPSAGRGLARRAADARRDDRAHAQVVPRDLVVRFRIITGVVHFTQEYYIGGANGILVETHTLQYRKGSARIV